MTEDRDIGCEVLRLAYDFRTRRGDLYIVDGECCDMSACIALFVQVDPAVLMIQTWSGVHQDTRYERRSDRWTARA